MVALAYKNTNRVATFAFRPHEVVTWDGFLAILKEFPEVLSTCWLPFPLQSNSSQTILIGFGLAGGSGDAALAFCSYLS